MQGFGEQQFRVIVLPDSNNVNRITLISQSSTNPITNILPQLENIDSLQVSSDTSTEPVAAKNVKISSKTQFSINEKITIVKMTKPLPKSTTISDNS